MLAFQRPLEALQFCLMVCLLHFYAGLVCRSNPICTKMHPIQLTPQKNLIGNTCIACKRQNCKIIVLLRQVQEELMNEAWSDEVLRLPACRPLHGNANEMLFFGPRIKMGIYEGPPTRCVFVSGLSINAVIAYYIKPVCNGTSDDLLRHL